MPKPQGHSRRSTRVLIGDLAVEVPALDLKTLLRVERYLARQARTRQARNAHNLGVRSLEHFYWKSYLALLLWRLTRTAGQ